MKFADRPIFILGCHKSGTSLLRSLLDSHDKLFAVPIESHFFRLTGRWVAYPLGRAPSSSLSLEEKRAALSAWIRNRNSLPYHPQRQFADSVTTGRWAEDTFESVLASSYDEHSGSEDARLFKAYVQAMHAALGLEGDFVDKRVVEKSVEHAEFAPLIKNLFPGATFVHIVRNPYANLVALRKKLKRYPFIVRELFAMYSSFYQAQLHRQVLPDYHVLKYEDLVKHPECEMRRVASVLDIPFTPSLLTPTSLGVPWAGNSTSKRSFEGVSTAPLETWQEAITPNEIALVSALLGDGMGDFGYERLEAKRRGLVRRADNEGPIAYALNRLLYSYLMLWNKNLGSLGGLPVSADARAYSKQAKHALPQRDTRVKH